MVTIPVSIAVYSMMLITNPYLLVDGRHINFNLFAQYLWPLFIRGGSLFTLGHYMGLSNMVSIGIYGGLLSAILFYYVVNACAGPGKVGTFIRFGVHALASILLLLVWFQLGDRYDIPYQQKTTQAIIRRLVGEKIFLGRNPSFIKRRTTGLGDEKTQ